MLLFHVHTRAWGFATLHSEADGPLALNQSVQWRCRKTRGNSFLLSSPRWWWIQLEWYCLDGKLTIHNSPGLRSSFMYIIIIELRRGKTFSAALLYETYKGLLIPERERKTAFRAFLNFVQFYGFSENARMFTHPYSWYVWHYTSCGWTHLGD